MKLYWAYLGMVWKSQLQDRTSFVLSFMTHMTFPVFTLTGLILLFSRFGSLDGWTMPQAMLCFAIIHMAFTTSEMFARGFDRFSELIRSGELDRILVRPRSPILQILGAKAEFGRLGRFFFSLSVLVYAAAHVDIAWSLSKVVLLVVMILGGSILFFAIFLLGATVCFWTVQGLEIVNIFTDGGREIAQYPLDIYRQPLTRFFTFVIPFAGVNYLPLSFLLSDSSLPLRALLWPLSSLPFLLLSLAVWRCGLRAYTSTGS